MANLNHLKVENAPAAFAEFAAKHNELVSLIESLEAATGIDIKIIHSPMKKLSVNGTPTKKTFPKGKIRIGLSAMAAASQVAVSTTGTPGGGGGSGNVGGTTQAVGSTGLLLDVLQPTSPNTPANYPTLLRTNNSGNIVSMDVTGLTVLRSNGIGLTVPFADISRNMGVKTISVCNGNTSMSMLVIASDPF